MPRNRSRHHVQPDVDDDADERDTAAIPLVATSTDVERIVWLLDTCRKRGYRIGPNVQVGDVIINVLDLRLAKLEGLKDSDVAPPSSSIWQEHGHDPDEDEPVDGTGGH